MALVVVERSISTSGHRVAASMTTRRVSPVGRGPHRSAWSLLHGASGIVEGLRGTDGGGGISAWQAPHMRTNASASVSIPGHHTLVRRSCLSLTIPWCDSCAMSNVCLRSARGITIRFPRRRIPFVVDSSSLTRRYALSSSSLGHSLVVSAFITRCISRSACDDDAISSLVNARGMALSSTASM